MRPPRLAQVLLASLALSVAQPPSAANAQFDPNGRKKTRPKPKGGGGRPKGRHHGTGGAEGGEGGKGPSAEKLIARYTAIVLSQPGAQFPLQRLAQLYRERDGKLEKLIAEFEERAQKEGSEHWNALVALAGFYRQDGQPDRAIATYEKAIAEKPKDAAAVLALAHLYEDRGDKIAARSRFEQALPLVKEDAEREQLLRTLMGLCLDAKDFAEAKTYHEELVKRAKGSFYVRAELGRELMLRSEWDRAVAEYRDVIKAAAGDNRVMGPALRDLGRALAKAGQRKEALETLHRALAVAGGQAGIRREIYEILVEVYRADERLAELIAELEKSPSSDPQELVMLGSLYEETGQVGKALTTYQKALAHNARDVETRLKVIRLLQIQGELDQAIGEYEALIRGAPRNPDFVFQLAEALIQRGDRGKALAHLAKLEARSQGDEETLAALVDFYERMDEKARAMALLERLGSMGGRDPQHLIDLGARYWEQGDKKKALETWARIKTLVADKAKAAQLLGEVYLDHELPKEGLAQLAEAVKLKPTSKPYRKAYALALERSGSSAPSDAARLEQYEEARRIWQQLLEEAGDDALIAREARQHIVSLWGLGGKLEQRIPALQRRLAASPPDLESGRLLAELNLRLRRFADAEVALRKVVDSAPGDVESLTLLERALVQQHKLDAAIEILSRLLQADPKRAREYYQRMAQYSAESYHDDRAVEYAAKAVELSPDDAEGHRKLGAMYRRRQDNERAIAAFRQAIAKNDRLFIAYLELADLLIAKGELEEADKLLRRVVRASPDEELVAQAARVSLQVNLGRGTLESLEKELLPVALGNPQKPIYRRLLVELYGALAFPLVQASHSADPEKARLARVALERIGERAVKPLLDALSDEREAQQSIALVLLAHIHNKGAGAALYAYATGSADTELRVRAMIALGSLGDPALLPKLTELLAPGGTVRADESDPVVVAAALAVARMRSPLSLALLTTLTASPAPALRALGALGLGLSGDKKAVPRLIELSGAVDGGALPRAAASFALGELGDARAIDALVPLAEATDTTLRAAALLALARLGAVAAPHAVAEALVSGEPTLVQAGAAAAVVMATRSWKADSTLSTEGSRVDVPALLGELRPGGYGPDDRARALALIGPELTRSAVAAVQSSPDRAASVAAALLSRAGSPAFAPLSDDLDLAQPEPRKQAEAAAESVTAAVVPAFVALSSHPSSDVRLRAVELLGVRTEASAEAAVIAAVADADPRVVEAALAGVARTRPASAIGAVARLLASGRTSNAEAADDDDRASRWAPRVRAAETLGVLGSATHDEQARAALASAATRDPYALVREAAVRALRAMDPDGAATRELCASIATHDPEERVRVAARGGGAK